MISVHNPLWIFTLIISTSKIPDVFAIWYGKVPVGGKFSYTVVIIIEAVDGTTSFCSGAIISTQHILTAAHCGYCTDDANQYKILVEDTSSSTGSQMYPVEKIHRHPDYEHGGDKWQLCRQYLAFCFLNRPLDLLSKNDIAVMKLQKQLILGKYVKKVALPLPGPLCYPVMCNFSSFGNTEVSLQTGQYSPSFRWTQFSIVDREHCQQREIHLITDEILCTVDIDKRSYPDNGDSGGPLVCGDAVYGVLSQGSSKADHPAVFTYVAHYLKFIFDILKRG